MKSLLLILSLSPIAYSADFLSSDYTPRKSINQTIVRERRNDIVSVYGDLRRPIGSVNPSLLAPENGGYLRLSGVSWTPVWDGWSVFQNTPDKPVNITKPNSILKRRDDMYLDWVQTLGSNTYSTIIQVPVSKNEITDNYTVGDIKTMGQAVIIQSRYFGLNLGLGALHPIGNKEDWINSHGSYTAVGSLGFSGSFNLFQMNIHSEAQYNFLKGENIIKGETDDIVVKNKYLGILNGASVTYRFTRWLRCGLEQNVHYREWKADNTSRDFFLKQKMLSAPTSLVAEITPWSGWHVSLEYGKEMLVNKDSYESNSQKMRYGASILWQY